jgi:tRNA A37 methylthiotransferase MiaB
VKLLDEILFDRIEVYKYQERPGLPSLELLGRVSEVEKKRR